MPELDESVRKWFTSRCIDDTDVENELDTTTQI